ncbi:MAG: hypothetical protein ACOCZ5_02810 [bacterium]
MNTDKIIELLKEKLEEEFVLQGHPDTGAFQNSLRGEVVDEDGKTIINIIGLEYGLYISKGVEAQNIPYTPSRGRGGQSKYITGLHNWVMRKMGISDAREALGIAFAIAKTHSEQGMPVRNGKLGSGFIESVREKYNQQINEMAKGYIDNKIKEVLNKK